MVAVDEKRASPCDSDAVAAVVSSIVRRDEAAYGRSGPPPDTLWNHLERTAAIAEQLGRAEGLDPITCRLAGLFHDAGKFHGGALHEDDVPEEKHSVAILREVGNAQGIPAKLIDEIADAILQLYRDDPDPTPLAMVVFDADNLDKLGPIGIATYFVKSGLRGRGVSPARAHGLTVELTYARHAPATMRTEAGRRWAEELAPQTERFVRSLLDQMSRLGLLRATVEEVDFEGLTLLVVTPDACACGEALARKVWEVPGMKCSEIHLEHRCVACSEATEVKFCRPRLPSHG